MQVATRLFYALATFFLGVIATANAPVIASAFGEPARWDSLVVTLVIAATIAGPLFFVGPAVVAMIRGDVAPGAGRSPRPSSRADLAEAMRWLDEVDAPARPAAERM